MKALIERRFQGNLGRVTSLVDLYDTRVSGSGRVPVADTDLLRAAVVFLHATLEDLLRSALDWKLPAAAPEHLADVPLVGCDKGGREPWCDLSDLARHRGKTVDDVLVESVTAYLDDSNFNHPGQIEAVLGRLSVSPAALNPYRSLLGPMMARRHWIVHRADRNDLAGSGQYAARSLSSTTVRGWRDAVRGFGADFLAML